MVDLAAAIGRREPRRSTRRLVVELVEVAIIAAHEDAPVRRSHHLHHVHLVRGYGQVGGLQQHLGLHVVARKAHTQNHNLHGSGQYQQITNGVHKHAWLGYDEAHTDDDLVEAVPHVEVLVVVILPQEQAVVKRDPRAVDLGQQAHEALVLHVCASRWVSLSARACPHPPPIHATVILLQQHGRQRAVAHSCKERAKVGFTVRGACSRGAAILRQTASDLLSGPHQSTVVLVHARLVLSARVSGFRTKAHSRGRITPSAHGIVARTR